MKMIWIQTYQNHLIYSIIYLSILIGNGTRLDNRYYATSIETKTIITGSSIITSNNDEEGEGEKDEKIISNALLSFLLGNSILLVIMTITLILLLIEIRYVIKRIRLPPGDSGYPIFGNFLEYIQDPCRYFTRKKEQFGSPVTSNFFMVPSVMFSHDDDVTWLNQQERKGTMIASVLSHLRNLLGDETIFCQNTMKHRRLRKIFEPVFSPNSVKEYTQLMDDTIQTFFNQKQQQQQSSSSKSSSSSSSSSFVCGPKEFASLAIKLFINTAFVGQLDDKVLERLQELFHIWFQGFQVPIPILSYIPGTVLYKSYCAKREMYHLIRNVVHDFQTKYPIGSQIGQNSLLGRLCYGIDDDGKHLTEEQLISNIQFILFAGHDTMKGSFCAFLHYLVEYPHIRQLLKEEVDQFVEPLDYDQLKTAPILNAFLAEVWRLVPPLDSHAMITTRELKYKQYTLPRGIYVTQDIQSENITNEERFLHSTTFRLERWIRDPDHPLYNPRYLAIGGGTASTTGKTNNDNNVIDYNVMSVKYRSFNFGPHMCLGGHFAKLEGRIILTRLLQRNYSIVEVSHSENTSATKKKKKSKLQTFPFRQYQGEFRLST